MSSEKKENVKNQIKKNIAKIISQNNSKGTFGGWRGSTLVIKNIEMLKGGSVERNKDVGPSELDQMMRTESQANF